MNDSMMLGFQGQNGKFNGSWKPRKVPESIGLVEVLMSNAVVPFLVRDSGGAVDRAACLDKFEEELVKYCAQREMEQETIAEAVHAAFDKYVGANITMPALCTYALTKLNAQPENHKILTERVLAYVRENSQGDKTAEDDSVERPDSTFVIGKGKHGGVRRRVDIVAKPAK